MSADQQSLNYAPWTAEWFEDSSDWVVMGAPQNEDEVTSYQPSICTLSDWVSEKEARVLAAAPELLAVAIKSHEPYVGLTDADVIDLYGGQEAALCLALRAAIAKALGETQ